jgi:pimeloyl-ACP methyl ester carboxylesterase
VPTQIFVHGACVHDAAWWWSGMSEQLAGHGIASIAVPLPSCGETDGELGDLYADVRACARAIEEADAPVILCGHSYGGMVITEAGVDERVTELLSVVSVMPAAGQSMADLSASEPAPWMVPGDDGTVGVDADIVAELFLQDCDELATRHALERLTRQSVTPFTQRPRAGWLARRYGLAANSVTAVEIVTPDGRLVRADADSECDLFWAVRGGGGSVGVVTARETTLYRGSPPTTTV